MRFARGRPLLWTAIAAYAAAFAALSVLRHDAFETGRFDLGNMVQAVWSTAHGHLLQVTNLHGVQVSRLAAHVDPILVVFAPLWWIWPSPSLLLTAQAVVVALGNFAAKLLLDTSTGITRLRGKTYPFRNAVLIPAFHPAAALRGGGAAEGIEADFALVKQVLDERAAAPEDEPKESSEQLGLF